MGEESKRPEIIRRLLEKTGTQEVDPTMLSGAISRGMQIVQLLYRAFTENKPVAWINVLTPPELFFGCGYIPFWLDGAGGFSGMIEMTEVFDHADAVLPSQDMCSFLRAAMGGAMLDLFPPPRVVVCTSHLCEGAPKIARMAAQHSGAEFHPLDVPSGLSDETVAYLAGQLERLAHRLCELSESKLDIDKMREAIDLSNQARKYFRRAYEMRKRIPAPVTGSQFISMGFLYPWGTQIGVSIAESLSDEIAGRIADNIPAVPDGEKYRLMWMHLRPVFETDIMAHLEQKMRAVIVVDLLSEAWWPELDAQDPFRALATRILTNPELWPMERKIERMLRLAEEYHIDGAVQFLQWGCRWNYGPSSTYKKAMTRAGFPFLVLDGDAVDKRATPYGQVLTRLEGFVELLESVGSQREPIR